MKRTILLAPIALAACTTTQPAVEIRTVEVPVIQQVPCPGIVPVRPAPMEQPLPTDATVLIARLAAKLLEYSGPGMYADQAEAYFEVCSAAGQ